eukprot:4724225-Pyramimonas_sp.AAC.1
MRLLEGYAEGTTSYCNHFRVSGLNAASVPPQPLLIVAADEPAGRQITPRTLRWPSDHSTHDAMAVGSLDARRNGRRITRRTTRWPSDHSTHDAVAVGSLRERRGG